MTDKLGQSDRQDLLAYLDGELSGPRAEQIAHMVEQDTDWRSAAEEHHRLNDLLDAYTVTPPGGDLSERIIGNVRVAGARPAKIIRFARIAAPLAAAAAVLIAVVLWHGLRQPPNTSGNQTNVVNATDPLAGLAEADKFVVKNLDFFQNYALCEVMASNEQILDLETLDAIDRLESRSRGL